MNSHRPYVGRRTTLPLGDTRVIAVSAPRRRSGASIMAMLMAVTACAESRRTLLVGTGVDADARAKMLGDSADRLGISTAMLAEGDRRSAIKKLLPTFRDHEVVVIDVGSERAMISAVAGTLDAHHLVVSASVDAGSLAASYAVVKSIHEAAPHAVIDFTVNRQAAARGVEAFRCVQSATSRFLNRELRYAGTIPEDEELRAAVLAEHPLPYVADRFRAGQTGLEIAARLVTEITTTAFASHAARQHSWRD